MVLISDAPIQHITSIPQKIFNWFFLATLCAGLVSLSGGVESADEKCKTDGLSVNVEFLSADDSPLGMNPVFRHGDSLHYRIILKNRGNTTLQRIEFQASLHSEGALCSTYQLNSGSRLPGNAISPSRSLSLTPGATSDLDIEYLVPGDLCPTTGHILVRLNYKIKDRLQAATLIPPIRYQIE